MFIAEVEVHIMSVAKFSLVFSGEKAERKHPTRAPRSWIQDPGSTGRFKKKNVSITCAGRHVG